MVVKWLPQLRKITAGFEAVRGEGEALASTVLLWEEERPAQRLLEDLLTACGPRLGHKETPACKEAWEKHFAPLDSLVEVG